MADAANGKSADLPSWVYRAGLAGLACILIWQASETLTEVRRLNERQVGMQNALERLGWRLDGHDRSIETHDRRVMNLERIAPRSGPVQ